MQTDWRQEYEKLFTLNGNNEKNLINIVEKNEKINKLYQTQDYKTRKIFKLFM